MNQTKLRVALIQAGIISDILKFETNPVFIDEPRFFDWFEYKMRCVMRGFFGKVIHD